MRTVVIVLGTLVGVVVALFALALWLGHRFAGPGEDATTCSRQQTALNAGVQLFVYQHGRQPTSIDELQVVQTDGPWHYTLGADGRLVPVPGSICDR